MKQIMQDEIKKAVAAKAASLVEDQMLIGLGTGSTVTYFIESLIARCAHGLKIRVASTSLRSQEQAQKGGIPFLDTDELAQLDLTIDGADEIDPQNCMIKGGGGALTREKILASSSKKMLVIVDESKLVEKLGKFGLPVEILPFCYQTTLAKIKAAGFDGKMRYTNEGSLYITDNGNYIYDIHNPKEFLDPQKTHATLATLPGVVETGLFFDLPVSVLVGYKDGRVEFRNNGRSANGRNSRIDSCQI